MASFELDEMLKELAAKEKVYYIVCVDFYKSSWGEHDAAHSEIIEIAAALVDFRNYEIVSEFHEYVRPTLRPRLNDHCRRLTGLTQSFIDGQDPFPIVYQKLIDWLETIAKENDIVYITHEYGVNRHRAGNYHATFFTWGSWNLNALFREECQRNSIKPPEYLKHWIDVRTYLGTTLKKFEGTFAEAMAKYHISYDKNECSAEDRVENLAILAIILEKHVNRPMNRAKGCAVY